MPFNNSITFNHKSQITPEVIYCQPQCVMAALVSHVRQCMSCSTYPCCWALTLSIWCSCEWFYGKCPHWWTYSNINFNSFHIIFLKVYLLNFKRKWPFEAWWKGYCIIRRNVSQFSECRRDVVSLSRLGGRAVVIIGQDATFPFCFLLLREIVLHTLK